MAFQVVIPTVLPFVLGSELASDLTVTVGAPTFQPAVTARPAETRWTVGEPALAWSVSAPVLDR